MRSDICVDASFVIALIVPERFTDSATKLWKKWYENDDRIAAPSLLRYEVTNAIYRKVFQGLVNLDDGEAALRQFLELDIEYAYLPALHVKASELAKSFYRPNTYDAHYLALAYHLNCPLWTADERLYNSVKDKSTSVKWIENSDNHQD